MFGCGRSREGMEGVINGQLSVAFARHTLYHRCQTQAVVGTLMTPARRFASAKQAVDEAVRSVQEPLSLPDTMSEERARLRSNWRSKALQFTEAVGSKVRRLLPQQERASRHTAGARGGGWHAGASPDSYRGC